MYVKTGGKRSVPNGGTLRAAAGKSAQTSRYMACEAARKVLFQKDDRVSVKRKNGLVGTVTKVVEDGIMVLLDGRAESLLYGVDAIELIDE